MVDYHDHYLKKDVLLLANVFEKFITESLKLYKLQSWEKYIGQTLPVKKFSCEKVQYRKTLISFFQQFFASIKKIRGKTGH